MFVLFLIPLTYSITTSDCESVACGTGITSGDCISVSGSTVTVYGCKAGYYCDYSVLGEVGAWQNVSCKYLFNSVNKCSNLQSDLTTGYVCCKDSECAQEKCSSNVCVGKSSGNSCSKSNQCAKGLYCDNKICKSLKKIGDKCDEDDECAIGAACSLEKCVKMFSLDPGQDADNGKVCTSNFADNGVCQNIEIYQNNKKLEYPYECNIGSDCIYKLSESESIYKTKPCVCGGSNSTTGFCSEFVRYTKDVNIMLSEMQYSDSKCSGSEAHTLNHHILYMCGSISFDMYYKYSRFMGQLLYHSLFNDESLKGCSMSLGIFDPYYEFSPKKDFSQYLKLSFLVITLLS
jgi:hypothetical protein